jgi:hypothetical protein
MVWLDVAGLPRSPAVPATDGENKNKVTMLEKESEQTPLVTLALIKVVSVKTPI